MVNEWHGIPFVRRWGIQEMGKVGIVLSRYELHLPFKWWRATRVFLQKQVKSLSVLQSLLKPLFCFSRASVAWLDTLAHFSVICCFQFAISLLSGSTTLKKRKQWPITTGFLHEKRQNHCWTGEHFVLFKPASRSPFCIISKVLLFICEL